MTPRFNHDCKSCVFLGNYLENGTISDLYWCSQEGMGFPTVLARFGDEPSDYISGIFIAKSRNVPSLTEALKLAREKSLKVD